MFWFLVEPLPLENEPIGDDQQALLAEFERRRRVRIKKFYKKS